MKVIGPILSFIAVYVLFFLDDGALFGNSSIAWRLVRRVSKPVAHRAAA